MKVVIAALALIVAMFDRCAAQSVTWELINEYPASSMAGEADAFFAAAVGRRTAGRLVIAPVPDAKSGLRTADQLKAVTEGRFAVADSFGGALGGESALFLLSTLPFLVSSTDDARALYETARPLYEALYAERRQRLLYVSPWPPSGLWSSTAVTSMVALRALKVRTYDKTSSDTFAQLAATAAVVSFADLNAKLASREIDAVLSSGDGGAGRELWAYLRFFSDIYYAVPMSFAAVSLDAWARLEDDTRGAIEEAANETTERQWVAMSGRVAKNFARMRQNGVTIDEYPPADILAALRAAAGKSIADWQDRAGPQANQLLKAYRSRPR
jgi:TRAP-type transport system periplasmic protein